MSAPETPLEMTRRHVAEGDKRIARQELLIGELDRHGHTALAQRARELLAQMEEFQRKAREHLDYEVAKLRKTRVQDEPQA